MLRWLAALLVALFTAQLTWAAVAPYCQHEATQTGHFGHHEHHHQDAAANDADETSGSSKSPLTVDLDCGQCHGMCAGLNGPGRSCLLLIPAARPAMPAAMSTAAGTVERPERPNWSALA